jgi:hemolysin-activating ACP:hemolysin acyltransferase
MQSIKSIYVLSDTKRLSTFSHIANIKRKDVERYIIPAFELRQCIEYVKHKSKHPYYIIKTNISDLKHHTCSKTDIIIIKNPYCSLDTKRIHYDMVSL